MTETNSLVHQPSLLKPIVRLAWPVVVEQLLVLMVGLVDTFLTGQFLETHHMAAMGQMAYLLWMIPALMSVISIGTTAVVAREIGAGRRDISQFAGGVCNRSRSVARCASVAS
jgi:Na+-driven multidrug efflux pump